MPAKLLVRAYSPYEYLENCPEMVLIELSDEDIVKIRTSITAVKENAALLENVEDLVLKTCPFTWLNGEITAPIVAGVDYASIDQSLDAFNEGVEDEACHADIVFSQENLVIRFQPYDILLHCVASEKYSDMPVYTRYISVKNIPGLQYLV